MLFKKKEFLPWNEYQERMQLLELVTWQQLTRQQSLRNMLAQGH